MRIRIHGARGSFPVAVGPKRIEAIIESVWNFAAEKNIKSFDALKKLLKGEKHSLHSVFGGATTCIELNSNIASMPIIFDAGTGLTSAALDSQSALSKSSFKQGRGKLAFFMTHTHWDHIIGLPTFEQLYRAGNEFHIYGVHKNLSKRLQVLFDEAHFPVPFHVVEKNLSFHQIKIGEPVSLDRLKITHSPQNHPGGSFAYRVDEEGKSFVLATDAEVKKMIDDKPSDFYRNVDVMVMDAQYTPEEIVIREGFGHSDIHTTVDFAEKMSTKHLVLFHQSPTYDDDMIDIQLSRAREYHSKKYRASKMKIDMAWEGMALEI